MVRQRGNVNGSQSETGNIKASDHPGFGSRDYYQQPGHAAQYLHVSLANNSPHISLGSRMLTRFMQDPTSGSGPLEEKNYSDLAIKIVEHFLPLFVGTYSAAPYRIDFMDFHPKRVLVFLPHELEYTHLRMLWRRWKKKADLKILGRSITPFGPKWLDRGLSRCFSLNGDVVPVFRLIDYQIAVMATDESRGLDGSPENDIRLKKDLGELGVFDPCMPLYMLYGPAVLKPWDSTVSKDATIASLKI